ncbi:hypothetical protein AM233_20895 [Bacillus sp. FJAT-22058]|nr:hypothetical protein AM233_20895 [Bacillus sp. FJAT-22058]
MNIIAAFFLTKIKVMVIIAAFFLTKIKVMVIIAAFFLTTIILFHMIKFVMKMKICGIYKRFTMWKRIKSVYFNHLFFYFRFILFINRKTACTILYK